MSSAHDGWSDDFSLEFLRSLYAEMANRFHLGLLRDAPALLQDTSPLGFIRHDVDVSLRRAVALAREEASWGVATTYHVMLDSPFYSLTDGGEVDRIREIVELGHEVGLHFDPVVKGRTEAAIADDLASLGQALGSEVRSLSFHRPLPELLRGPLTVCGCTSGYGAPLMQAYISDSAARWREGNPIDSIRSISSSVAQVLVHPEWWGPKHAFGPDRLDELTPELASDIGRSHTETAAMLTDHISVTPRSTSG